MAHYCVCTVCGVRFDRDKEQAVIVGSRRYAHQTCDPSNTNLAPPPAPKDKDDEDLESLKTYIDKVYGEKANWALINKQIKKFKKENGYSYSGMQKSLTYFYEIKKNTIDKSNGGIGIIEYCYQDAYNYYLGLFLAQQANEDKSLITKVKEYIIRPPQAKSKKIKLFDMEWEEDEE